MKLRYGLAFLAAALISIPTASAASLNLASTHLTAVQTCILSGYPNADTGEIDAMVEQNHAGTNYGTNAAIDVESHTTTNIRTYIEFLITGCTPAIPSTARPVSDRWCRPRSATGCATTSTRGSARERPS